MGSTCKKYLGFLLDTERMVIFLPNEKIEKVRKLFSSLLPMHKANAKELAKVLGNIAVCLPSHGPFSRVCTRSGYLDLVITETKGWKIDILVSSNMKKELLLDCVTSMNGMPIQNKFTDVRVDFFISQKLSQKEIGLQSPNMLLMQS